MVFRQSTSDRTGDPDSTYLELRGEVVAEPGSLEFHGTATGNLEVSGLNVIQRIRGADADTVNIRFTTEGISRLRQQFDQVFSVISDQTGVPERLIRERAQGGIPDKITNITNENVPVQASFASGIAGGVATTGQGEVDVDRNLSYPAPVIVAPESFEDRLEELPSLDLIVEARPRAWLQRFAANPVTLRFSVPADEFIEIRDINEFPCSDLFPDIDSQISDLESNIEPLADRMEDEWQEAQRIRNEIQRAVEGSTRRSVGGGAAFGGGGRPAQPDFQLSQVSPQELVQNIDLNQAAEWRSTVQNVRRQGTEQIRDLKNRVESLQEDIGSRVGIPRCSDTFEGRLEDLKEKVETALSRASNLVDVREELLSLLSGIGDRDCVEEFSEAFQSVRDVRDEASSIVSQINVEDFELSDLRNPPEDLRAELTSRLDDIESRYQDILDGPCAPQLESELESARGQVQRIQLEDLGCGDVARQLRAEARGYPEQVSGLLSSRTSRITPDKVQSLVKEGDDIMSKIQSEVPDRNPCKGELMSDVRQPQGELENFEIDLGDVPCSNQFKKLFSDVSEFEQEVASLGLAPKASDISSLVRTGEELASRVEEQISEDNPCRTELSSRVRSAVNGLERGAQSPQLNIDIPDERVNERRQQLENLRSRLEGISLGP